MNVMAILGFESLLWTVCVFIDDCTAYIFNKRNPQEFNDTQCRSENEDGRCRHSGSYWEVYPFCQVLEDNPNCHLPDGHEQPKNHHGTGLPWTGYCSATVLTQACFPLPWTEKLSSKREAPGSKSTPSRLTKVCSWLHGQRQLFLENVFMDI